MFLSTGYKKQYINLNHVVSFEKAPRTGEHVSILTRYKFIFENGEVRYEDIWENDLHEFVSPTQIIPALKGQYLLDYAVKYEKEDYDLPEYYKYPILAWSVFVSNPDRITPILFDSNFERVDDGSNISVLMPDGTVVSRGDEAGDSNGNFESIEEWLKENRKRDEC